MNVRETRKRAMEERAKRIAQRKTEAKKLQSKGWSYKAIAKKMGVAKLTAMYWCKN